MTFAGMEMEGQSQNWSSPRLDRVVTGSLVGWLVGCAEKLNSFTIKKISLAQLLSSLSHSLTHAHTRTNSLSYHGISCLHSPLQTHTLSHANMFTHILSYEHTNSLTLSLFPTHSPSVSQTHSLSRFKTNSQIKELSLYKFYFATNQGALGSIQTFMKVLELVHQ